MTEEEKVGKEINVEESMSKQEDRFNREHAKNEGDGKRWTGRGGENKG